MQFVEMAVRCNQCAVGKGRKSHSQPGLTGEIKQDICWEPRVRSTVILLPVPIIRVQIGLRGTGSKGRAAVGSC